ncbi:mCG147816 [Mus musculus]|nr:mCG147816 [Mus musculus]
MKSWEEPSSHGICEGVSPRSGLWGKKKTCVGTSILPDCCCFYLLQQWERIAHYASTKRSPTRTAAAVEWS